MSQSSNRSVALKDKSVLILAGDNDSSGSLAISLAQVGADLAVAYHPSIVERIQETKAEIEALGQRCLTLPIRRIDEIDSVQVVSRTLLELGSIDVFIDYASMPPKGVAPVAADSVQEPRPLTNVAMLVAALDQMVEDECGDGEKILKHDKESNQLMRIGRDLINKPIFTIQAGKKLGSIQDVYLNQDLTRLVAIYLGSGGLLDRREALIRWQAVVTAGEDAILVRDEDCVEEEADVPDLDDFVRRDGLNGRSLNTPGGTRIGTIGDVILDEEGRIIGFSLPQTYVTGPIADNRAISRSAVLNIDHQSGVLTADLSAAEEDSLRVAYEGLFAEPAVSVAETDDMPA